MSTGAKRPLEEALPALPCPLARLAKRRKQSTPVRISGGPHDPGPLALVTLSGPEPPLLAPEDQEDEAVNYINDDEDRKEYDCVKGEGFKTFSEEDELVRELRNDQSGAYGDKENNEFSSQNSKGYLDKYKEHIEDNQVVYERQDYGKRNDIERLNSYRIKESKRDGVECQVGYNREESLQNTNERYRPHSVGEKQTEERIPDRYRPQSVNDQQQSSPNESDKYALNPNGRYPCRVCGIIFLNSELLRSHFESEHTERNGRNGVECKIEPYESEDNSPGTSVAPTPGLNMPDPRMEAWGTDFQAKMADLYKNALGFPHEISKDSLPGNFNPLCPPFPLFPGGVPPQRPMMEPIRIFNPEAYCELCSKEFCNKYFLKTHKANKHGIYENNPSGSGTDGLNLDASFIPAAFASSALKFKNNMMLADYAKSYEAALLASQRQKAKIQKMMEEAREIEKTNAETQSAALHMPVNPRQLQLDDVRSSSDDNTIPENFIYKGENRQDQEEQFMTPTPRKLSPDSSKKARDSGFSADMLRRLGVINPEAFCKICCKEYCNKYFLKTHKIKRHGLLPSPTDKYVPKECTPQMPGNFERKDGQTSPLNLIMSEDQEKRQSPEGMLTPKHIKEMLTPTNNVRPLSTQSIESNITEGKREALSEEAIKNEQAKQSPTTIFISEDLQKLQTMISQLNDLSVNKIVECYVCKKEFDNNYVLQFHMMSDHGISMPGSIENFTFPSVSGEDTSIDGSIQQKPLCTICEKEFPSVSLLKKHIEEFHTPKMAFNEQKLNNMDGLSPDKESIQQRERRASMSLTPTNSYCEICNKELCNKYFMKTHMQRMHGIEIENGTQIGGVICDICNKELCSKYFLRVHKHNTHGIVEPGAPLPQMRALVGEPEQFNVPPVTSPLKQPPEASILNNRFIAHFIEVCPFCSRRFRTSKWLKAHLLSDHGKAGVDKWKELEVQYKMQAKAQQAKSNKQLVNPLSIPDASNMSSNSQNMPLDLQERLPFYSKLVEPKLLNMFNLNNPDIKTYNCSYCPFSTSILSFLYVHEKSHVQGPEMDILCPMCPESFSKPEALQFHIITTHSLPEWRDRPGLDSSPTSTRECQSRQKTPETNEDKEQIQQGNGHSKLELFECYECDFKTCNFGEMETHLRSQHYAVRDGAEEPMPAVDGVNNLEDERRKSKMPAIYAVPRTMDSEGDQTAITMQPFVIEENTPEESGGKFVPSVVFLPVRRRATGAITISFNLTPA